MNKYNIPDHKKFHEVDSNSDEMHFLSANFKKYLNFPFKINKN